MRKTDKLSMHVTEKSTQQVFLGWTNYSTTRQLVERCCFCHFTPVAVISKQNLLTEVSWIQYFHRKWAYNKVLELEAVQQPSAIVLSIVWFPSVGVYFGVFGFILKQFMDISMASQLVDLRQSEFSGFLDLKHSVPLFQKTRFSGSHAWIKVKVQELFFV